MLRTHLLVNSINSTSSTNIYNNTLTASGVDIFGIFFNTGSYFIVLPAGIHSISLEDLCFINIKCKQGGNAAGTSFQAVAIYNDF